MNNFNKNFYQPNTTVTLKDAENVMIENGYSNFSFKSHSITNGASFYFEVDGQEVRVSDHPLTGRRAFEIIQLSFCKTREVSLPVRKNAIVGYTVIDGSEFEVKLTGSRYFYWAKDFKWVSVKKSNVVLS